jgi:hypothetical protein
VVEVGDEVELVTTMTPELATAFGESQESEQAQSPVTLSAGGGAQ